MHKRPPPLTQPVDRSRRRWLLGMSQLALVAAAPTAVRAAKPRRFCLVLDPGHGGRNRGCRALGGQLFEKDYTLAVCQKLRRRLADQPGLELHLTRRDDQDRSSAERIAVAETVKADLVLSIHANASDDHTQSGFESFVLCPDRAKVRRWVDATEPGAEPGAEVDPVLLRVRSHEALRGERDARRFAEILRDTQRRSFPGRVDRGVRHGRFDLLVECRRPTVLHELGFMDHRREGRWMQRAESMDRIVESLAVSVQRHLLRLSLSR